MRPAAELLNKLINNTDGTIKGIMTTAGIDQRNYYYWSVDNRKMFFDDMVKVAGACGYKILAVRGEEVIEVEDKISNST